MKLFITILKLTIIFIKLTKKKRMISPKTNGKATKPCWKAPETSQTGRRGGCRKAREKDNWVFSDEKRHEWLATQVGRRPVKAGLEGHDAGVSGVDDGVKNSSILLRKRGRTAQSVRASFSDFRVVVDENRCEIKSRFNTAALQQVLNDIHRPFRFLWRSITETTAKHVHNSLRLFSFPNMEGWTRSRSDKEHET